MKHFEKKNSIMDLRKQGFSYSEIRNVIPVPKSTLSWWLRDFKIRPEMRKRIVDRQLKGILHSAEKRKEARRATIAEIKKSTLGDVKEISKKELWLMGVALYWGAGYREKEHRPAQGVRFTNSDPYLIKLFLKWLVDVGKISRKEIAFDIFINENKKNSISNVIYHWSQVTDFAPHYFSHVYFLKYKLKRAPHKTNKKDFGLLRIRVKASSMLNRQIEGWIRGICRSFWKTSEREIYE